MAEDAKNEKKDEFKKEYVGKPTKFESEDGRKSFMLRKVKGTFVSKREGREPTSQMYLVLTVQSNDQNGMAVADGRKEIWLREKDKDQIAEQLSSFSEA